VPPRPAHPQPGGGGGGSGGGSGSGSGGGSGSGKPPPPPPPPAIPEQLGHLEFVTAMKKIEPAVQQCRRRGPLRTTVRVKVQVAPSGHVDDVTLPKRLALLAPCVKQAVRGAVFPATKHGGRFDYELTI
jgi:hypothetical protein